MNCPKCKTEVNPKDTVCPNCKLRLVFECPRCKSQIKIGSSSCKKCGFVFVKFCPECNSANYVSSTHCRKCFHHFKEDEETLENIQQNTQTQNVQPKEDTNKADLKKDTEAKAITAPLPRLNVYIDFITLKNVFDKYKDEEFKQKVVLNIKTATKLAFNVTPDFIKEDIVNFKINYSKKIGFLEKVNKFSEEFSKFNLILNETLGADISFKFAVQQEGETKTTNHSASLKYPVKQLEYGIEKDIITSEGAYKILSDEIPLIKISPESYKMVFLDQKPEFTQSKSVKEDVALELIYDTINDSSSEIKGISLNAPRGAGKSFLLEKLYKKLEDTNILVLKGHCSALTQITPFGLFQDILLSLFNLSFVPSKYEKRVNELRNILQKNLSFMNGKNGQNNEFNPSKIETLINLVYPVGEDFYENILTNKQKTFSQIKDVLEALAGESRLVIVVDDFDLIDETSFEFIKYLANKDFFTQGTKFLLTYRNQHALNMYINSDKLPKNATLNINLAANEIEDIKEYLKLRFGSFEVLPEKVSNQIILNSQGNFAYIEQVTEHLFETKRVYLKGKEFAYNIKEENYFVPQTLGEILDARLKFLKETNFSHYALLGTASLLGGKFTKSILQTVFELSDDNFAKTVSSLEKTGYFIKKSENIYRFKNTLIWTHIYSEAKNSESLKPYAAKLLNETCERTISSPAIRALLAQTIGDKSLAFDLWTANLKLASFIGDVAFYTMCQKQSLANLEEMKHPNAFYIKNNIFERLGKLTYNKNPKEAVDYLSSALINAKNRDEEEKVIELSGYLIHSLKMVQNFPAIIETVDTVLQYYDKPKFALQRALIKTRKAEALLYTGNFEEVNTIVNTEINPPLQDWLKHPKKNEFSNIREIYSSWIKANIILIEALAEQGNPAVFELIDAVEKEVFKEKKKEKVILEPKIIVNLKLATAFAYTIKGYLSLSDEILQSIVKDFSYAIDDSKLVSKWNTIDIFNKILRNDFDEKIRDELFEAVTFANNCGDNYNKNIIKAVLAYVILEEGNALKSLEICAEEMTWFSKEKIALGALISWYISAKATMATNGADKAIEICEKAIKICESTKINTVYFKILFQSLMARAYLNKGELDNAKTYSELAFQDANINELIFLQMILYKLRANIMQDSITTIDSSRKLDVAQNTIKTYEKALNIATNLNLTRHHYIIQKELTSFKAYCQLKRIM